MTETDHSEDDQLFDEDFIRKLISRIDNVRNEDSAQQNAERHHVRAVKNLFISSCQKRKGATNDSAENAEDGDTDGSSEGNEFLAANKTRAVGKYKVGKLFSEAVPMDRWEAP